MSKGKELRIINSTEEFLVFSLQNQTEGIQVFVKDENLWMSQKLMAQLFDCSTDNIGLHLKNIYAEGELDINSTTEDFSVVQKEGKRTVPRPTKLYNLDAIISVGYRVNSYKATQFRQWATKILKEFTIKGFVLDDKRLKNGTFFNKDYFEELLVRIREIRSSERRFYQKITDIYATAVDYTPSDKLTKKFFAAVQNKLHFAITGHTAAELIVDRANSDKPNMGLTSWKDSPDGKILETDITVAKNYLSEEELDNLNRIVSMYLDYAEMQAKKHIPMTMADWNKKLDAFLQFNDRKVLTNAGKISKEFAKQHADTEYAKYRIIQDKNYLSDFDKEINKIKQIENKGNK